MFYSVFVLGKKGPLARVWLAAHWDKKITKAQILETNIVESVDSILQPKIKLSLRTSSHLLLGIVRIYARKTLYLLQDCQDAAFKIKSAFRPGAVDLPDGKTEAAISAITLPEMLDFINDFDLIAEPPIQMEPPATSANIRSITLVEDISSIHVDDPLMNDVREWSDMSSVHVPDRVSLKDGSSLHGKASKTLDLFDDGFGGQVGVGIVDEDIFDMQVPPEPMQTEQPEGHEEQQQLPPPSVQRPDSRMSDRSDSMYDSGPASMAPSGPPSTPGSVPPPPIHVDEDEDVPFPPPVIPTEEDGRKQSELEKTTAEKNTMVLEPLEEQALERRRKRRKKLGMVVDEVKTLSGEEMKAQLSDTSDIVTTLDLAPPSKKLMNWKKTGGSEKLFALPERLLPSKCLLMYYSRHLITNRIEHEEEPQEEEELVNGDITQPPPQPLQELEDIEEQLPQSPIDLQPPKTPKTPSYHKTPPKKKRKHDVVDDEERVEKPERTKKARNHQINHDYQPEPEPQPVVDESRVLSMQESMRAASMQASEQRDEQYQPFQPEDDDDDGYEPPMSVGPPEEMYPDETAEQFEERMRNKRTNILLKFMVNQLENEGEVLFSNLVRNNRRKQVAQKFFSLLVLKKQMAIELTQEPNIPYAEIVITAGSKFDDSLSSSML